MSLANVVRPYPLAGLEDQDTFTLQGRQELLDLSAASPGITVGRSVITLPGVALPWKFIPLSPLYLGIL